MSSATPCESDAKDAEINSESTFSKHRCRSEGPMNEFRIDFLLNESSTLAGMKRAKLLTVVISDDMRWLFDY